MAEDGHCFAVVFWQDKLPSWKRRAGAYGQEHGDHDVAGVYQQFFGDSQGRHQAHVALADQPHHGVAAHHRQVTDVVAFHQAPQRVDGHILAGGDRGGGGEFIHRHIHGQRGKPPVMSRTKRTGVTMRH